MGRKLEFCRDKALHTAMESFWAHGYESTSMRDLAHKLGLHLGSVYNALGDKEKVFEAALKLNLEEEVLPRMKLLVEDTDPMKAIDRHLTYIVEECAKPDSAPGCFVVNSLLEITEINERITNMLHGYMAQVEDSFVTCIENAKKKGQIPASHDARKDAHFIMGVCLAMRGMAKLKAPASTIDDLRECALKALAA